jgi:hypothetical protein
MRGTTYFRALFPATRETKTDGWKAKWKILRPHVINTPYRTVDIEKTVKSAGEIAGVHHLAS